MSPKPSIIKVEPALNTLDITSADTWQDSYRRSDYDAFEMSSKRQDDVDQTDEDVDAITGSDFH